MTKKSKHHAKTKYLAITYTLCFANIVTAASVRVGTVGSLPIVSLLPTLTEEMSLTIAQSAAHPGWFRRHYTRCVDITASSL